MVKFILYCILPINIFYFSILPERAKAEDNQYIQLTYDPWCPHTCEGDPPGFITEITTAAFKNQNILIKYHVNSWARAINDTRDGNFHGIVGALIKDAPDFIFPKSSIGNQESCFYNLATSKLESFTDLRSLKGQRLGLVRDYAYGPELDQYISSKDSSGPKLDYTSGTNTAKRLAQKLLLKRIDIMVEDKSVMNYTIKTNPDIKNIRTIGCLQKSPLFVAFSPKKRDQSIALAKALDEGIEKIKSTGEYSLIARKYNIETEN